METLIVLFGALGTLVALAAATRALRAPVAEVAPAGEVRTPDAGGGIGALAAPRDPVSRLGLRRELVQAGWRGNHVLARYLATRATLALALPLATYVIARPGTLLVALSLSVASAALGYYIPMVWMRAQRAERQARLLKAFPNALDMLVSCLEAGLSLDPSLRRVARELEPSAPELAQELQTVFDESAAGIPRIATLRHLDERTGLNEFSSLVNVMADAERYGASIAASIRSHAQLTRRRRALEIEKRAAQAAPKLTIAMVLFIFPALFVVTLGPMVVQLFDRMLPTLTGGSP
ncbi:hypothetical protein LBMAG42_21520 [Deltaproteobacteria bacterium]|nr:hypothetical protein LBMAG42_21520 [Deltaproteobacteria bacterium]